MTLAAMKKTTSTAITATMVPTGATTSPATRATPRAMRPTRCPVDRTVGCSVGGVRGRLCPGGSGEMSMTWPRPGPRAAGSTSRWWTTTLSPPLTVAIRCRIETAETQPAGARHRPVRRVGVRTLALHSARAEPGWS